MGRLEQEGVGQRAEQRVGARVGVSGDGEARVLDANETYRVGLNAEGEAEARQLDQVDGGEVVDGGRWGLAPREDVGEILEAQEDARHRAQGGALRRMHQVEQRQARTAQIRLRQRTQPRVLLSLLLAKTRTRPIHGLRPPAARRFHGRGGGGGGGFVARCGEDGALPPRWLGARMERDGLARKGEDGAGVAKPGGVRLPEMVEAELQPRAACGERRIGLGVRGERAVRILPEGVCLEERRGD